MQNEPNFQRDHNNNFHNIIEQSQREISNLKTSDKDLVINF